MSATARRGCEVCDHTGWVCENHPTKPWRGSSTRADACDCGAGTLCRCAMSANETLDIAAEANLIAWALRGEDHRLAQRALRLADAVRERDAEIARLKDVVGQWERSDGRTSRKWDGLDFGGGGGTW